MGAQRSLHRRASMGKRSRSFYLDSDLNLDPACKSDVYTVDCTSKGCKTSMTLIGGSSMQTRPTRIAEGKLKVGREMPSQEHGEDGQCGDLEYSLRRSNKRLVSFFFPSIVR